MWKVTAKTFNSNRKRYDLGAVEVLLGETLQFTAKEWDEETKLYYMSARYQNPMTSRWMSADPAGASLVNPMGQGFSLIQSLNWYSYTSNNPVNYTDPTGLLIPIEDVDNNGLLYNPNTERYLFNDGRNVKDETHIEITRNSEEGYYNDSLELKVGNTTLLETSVQSEADWPGYEGDTVAAGEYDGYMVDASGTYDNPILLVNEALGVEPGDATMIHPNKVTNESEIQNRFTNMEKIGPWAQPFSQNCQITNGVKPFNDLIDTLGSLGFTPRGRFDGYGNIYGNPDVVKVRIYD